MIELLISMTKLENIKVFSLSGTPGADPAELLFQIHLLKPFNDIVHTRHLLQNQELLYDYCREHISCVVGSCNRRVFAEERELEVVSVPLSFKQYCQVAQRYDIVKRNRRGGTLGPRARRRTARRTTTTTMTTSMGPTPRAKQRMQVTATTPMPRTGRPFLNRHRATCLTGGSARSSCGGSTAAARRMTMRDCNAPSRYLRRRL